MAHVASLTLSHFRSHRRTRLDVTGPVVAVHGDNGAGKTNLLEAVSLLSPGRGMRRATIDQLARRPESVGWRVAADVMGERPHEVELRAEPGQSRTTRIDGQAAPQVALARIMRVLWLVPAMDRLWLEGPEGRRRFLDRMTLTFAPDHADGALAYERAMRDRNRLLKDGVRDAGWYDALEHQMARAGAGIAARRRDALARLQAAQDTDGPFPAARLSLIGPDGDDMPEGADSLRDALARGRRRDMAAGRTLMGPHRVDLVGVYATKAMPAGACSTGEQKALLISLVLANARALADSPDGPPVLLLDEVAAHLDAGRRAALYGELGSLGAQAWLTGTGPELFAGLDGAQHVRIRDDAGESVLEDAAAP
ncbi:DNA replication/repair protein RecF [Jannaschia sp. LMIT008]|uniref:DNA replication/repair protein RecF n=1 Tax=Jannaschia maritima TaxID=3032585 RepID=UPI0028119C93|nr:DNA replication/repair protein RecF [Jannaschia sp. LMIT008]